MKYVLLRHCKGTFFMLYFSHKGVDYMSNISDYIKSNKKLKSLDFLTVYLTIVELVKDGQINV